MVAPPEPQMRHIAYRLTTWNGNCQQSTLYAHILAPFCLTKGLPSSAVVAMDVFMNASWMFNSMQAEMYISNIVTVVPMYLLRPWMLCHFLVGYWYMRKCFPRIFVWQRLVHFPCFLIVSVCMYIAWIKNVKRFLSTTVCARERSKQSDCKINDS